MDRRAKTIALNVPLERRLKLALGAAYELRALVDVIRQNVKLMESADSGDEEAIVYALLDRLEIVGQELSEVAYVVEDPSHDPQTLGARLRAA